MSGPLTRFLGDSPFRVALKLLALSFVVGLVLSALDLHPYQIYWWMEELVWRVYDMGFGFLQDALSYLILGALIVIPVFLLMRLLKLGAGRAGRPD